MNELTNQYGQDYLSKILLSYSHPKMSFERTSLDLKAFKQKSKSINVVQMKVKWVKCQSAEQTGRNQSTKVHTNKNTQTYPGSV